MVEVAKVGEGGRGSSVAVPTVVVAPLAVKAVLAMVEARVEKERLVVEERGNRGWWWRRRRRRSGWRWWGRRGGGAGGGLVADAMG